jgi:hypothetical protein
MNRNYADDTIDTLAKAAASIGRPVHNDSLGGLCYITSAGVHRDGRHWLGLGHHPGECVAPAIVYFLPVVRHHDGTLSLTGSTPDKGAIEGLVPSAVPDDRVATLAEPAQGGGDWAALGRASTEEPTT